MKIKKAIFLSHAMNNKIPVYGGAGEIIFRKVKSIKKGDSCNTMFWAFPNHIGTHVDAPSHFIEFKKSISELTPKSLIFNKIVLLVLRNIQPGFIVTEDDLKGIRDCDLLLIKTRFEAYRNRALYWRNSVSLSPKLASWLKKKCPSIRAVGIDSISISNLSKRELGREAHKAFLGNNILLIEDMKLRDLKGTPDLVIVSPLLVEKADGSPCTVFGLYH